MLGLKVLIHYAYCSEVRKSSNSEAFLPCFISAAAGRAAPTVATPWTGGGINQPINGTFRKGKTA